MPRPLAALDATLVSGTSTGDSSYWTGLLRGLIEAAPEIDIALLSHRPEPPEGIRLPAGFRWIQVSGKPGRWFSYVSLPLAARRLGAQVFHTQYTLSPLARGGVTTIHDVSFLIGPEWFRPKDLFLLRRTVPASARRATKVIAVSETSKREIVEHLRVAPSKVAVTYNGVASHFGPTDSAATTQKLGISGPYIMAIGARWPRKNLKLAIEAAGLLPPRIQHKLVIVGKEGWGDEGTNSRVLSTGYVPNEDLPALYSGASLLVFPSKHEGFGIPVVEAFACGTPVLASSGGALPEVAGGAAEILASWDAATWANRIESLLTDSSKLDAMRQRGFARAKDFDWNHTARQTADVYLEVAG